MFAVNMAVQLKQLENAVRIYPSEAMNRLKRVALMYHVLLSVDSREPFFCILAMADLIDHFEIHNKLEQLNLSISSNYRVCLCRGGGGSWQSSKSKDLKATTILSPVISKLEDFILQELRASADVRRQARRLLHEFKLLNDFIKEVESAELSSTMAWMEKIGDFCRLAENVVGLYADYQRQWKKSNGRVKFGNLVSACRNFISNHKLAGQLRQIQQTISDIFNTMYRASPLLVHPYDVYRGGRPFREGNDDQFDTAGFDEDVDAVIALLLKDDCRCITISISGATGVGKNFLTKLIYNSQIVAHHFPGRIWVSPDGFIMEQITGLKDFPFPRKSMSMEERKNTEEKMKQTVNACLADKRHLIVVEIGYTKRFWEEMGVAFRGLSNGTRILFTVNQLNNAPPVTETDFTYRLHLRDDDESWTLFKSTLNMKIPPMLEKKFKDEILRKCGGLPNMIKKLEELLSQRDATTEEWSRVFGDQRLQHIGPWFEILEEISQNLPLHLRRCLFYFGLFPANYMVPARRLIALWVAEGLAHQSNDSRPAEYVAEEYLNELVSLNMVRVTKKKLNGKIKRCCLPEALRLHWYTKATEASFLQGHSDKTSGVRRLTDHLDPNDALFDHIHGNNSTSLNSCYSSVFSFLSFDTRGEGKAGEDVGNFLDRCISGHCFHYLWVLDLEQVYKPKLPKAITRLTRLKYLGLRSSYLEGLPMFIDKLLSLQTLDLKRTCISSLPSSIWKMQKLRHLFLDESYRNLFTSPPEDKSLAELQTLWGAFVDEDSPINNGLDTLSSITKLGLKCKISAPSRKDAMSAKLITVANWIQSLKKLRSLRLKSFDESNRPWDLHLESLSSHEDLTDIYLVGKILNQHLVSEFPESLNELTLSASGLAEDSMQMLEKLPNLKIVILLLGSYTGKKMLCSSGGFQKLQVLKLKKLVQLEEWKAEEGAMPCLKNLEIESCSSLKSLPDGLKFIRFLREVKLIKLPMLSSKLKDKQSADRNKISHVRDVLIED